MNNSKFLLGLLLVFLNFNLTSCEDKNEAVDPVLLIPVVPVNTCSKPDGLSVSDFIGSAVNLTWTASEGVSWEIQYGLNGFVAGSGTSVSATTTSKTISGLTPTNDYDFYIRTNCEDGSHSNWVGPVGVGSEVVNCSTPTNLTALRAANNTEVNVTWGMNGDESTWEVQYGAFGFDLGSGTIVTATTNSKLITGLTNSAYDFYVRSVCSSTDSSSWAGPFHVNSVP